MRVKTIPAGKLTTGMTVRLLSGEIAGVLACYPLDTNPNYVWIELSNGDTGTLSALDPVDIVS